MAVSGAAGFLESLYRDWSARMAVPPGMSLPATRSLFEEWQSATREPEGVTYRSESLAGIEGIWCLPAGSDRSRVLLYLHGGGFMCGSPSSHRKLAAHLARAMNSTALVIDYRRTPEFPYPAQIDDTRAVFDELLSRGFSASDVFLGGDSAGAAIAVSAVARQLRDNSPRAGGVICISPWLDLELTGSSLTTSAATDFLIASPSGPELIAAYLGSDARADDPSVNPILADLTGFPPLYITAGSGEGLRDDAITLNRRAQLAGVDSTLSLVDGMQHVFVLMAGRAAEADDEIERIAAWFRSHTES